MSVRVLITGAVLIAAVAGCGHGSPAVLSAGSPSPTDRTVPPATAGSGSATAQPTGDSPAPSPVSALATVAGTVSASPAPAPTPTRAPTPSATPRAAGHTLTGANAGSTVHVHVGDTIAVDLGSSFHQPVSSDSAVLERISSSGGYGTDQDARATFRALSKGSAALSSYNDYPCLHTTPPCEIAQQQWMVQVVVD